MASDEKGSWEEAEEVDEAGRWMRKGGRMGQGKQMWLDNTWPGRLC